MKKKHVLPFAILTAACGANSPTAPTEPIRQEVVEIPERPRVPLPPTQPRPNLPALDVYSVGGPSSINCKGHVEHREADNGTQRYYVVGVNKPMSEDVVFESKIHYDDDPGCASTTRMQRELVTLGPKELPQGWTGYIWSEVELNKIPCGGRAQVDISIRSRATRVELSLPVGVVVEALPAPNCEPQAVPPPPDIPKVPDVPTVPQLPPRTSVPSTCSVGDVFNISVSADGSTYVFYVKDGVSSVPVRAVSWQGREGVTPPDVPQDRVDTSFGRFNEGGPYKLSVKPAESRVQTDLYCTADEPPATLWNDWPKTGIFHPLAHSFGK